MPTERLSMRKIRDVLRLKFESGLSERVIGRAMSLSNGSVNSYLQRARMAGLGWPLPDGLDDAALERLLFPPAAAPDAAGARARPEWAALDKGDAAQGRHPGALVGGVSRRSSGRVRLQLVLRAIRRLQEPAAPVDAAKPCRRREGVRRLRRRHDRRHRPFDRRGAADEAVRRRHGRVELHLRAGAAERADRRLDRRARGPARFPGRRAEVRGLRQSQGRGHQPGPLRAGPEPQLSGVRRPLRRGDPAGAALQTARQGQGRAVGPDRRALDSGQAAQSAVLQRRRSQRRDRRTRRRHQRPRHEGLRREPCRTLRPSTSRR